MTPPAEPLRVPRPPFGEGQGRWVKVRVPGGAKRIDWVPTSQPLSPDGSNGVWHVLGSHRGQGERWEWIRKGGPIKDGMISLHDRGPGEPMFSTPVRWALYAVGGFFLIVFLWADARGPGTPSCSSASDRDVMTSPFTTCTDGGETSSYTQYSKDQAQIKHDADLYDEMQREKYVGH